MADAKLNIEFDVTPPSQARSSRYQPLYDQLNENLKPGQWANVTQAIKTLAEGSDSGKVPNAQAAAVTLRKNGFEATTRGDQVFAGKPEPEAKDKSKS